MLRVRLPSRSVTSPDVLFSPDRKALDGYWLEGYGYAITPQEAQQIRDAAVEITRLFVAAMDYITSHDEVLFKISITGKKEQDRKILELARTSWKSENIEELTYKISRSGENGDDIKITQEGQRTRQTGQPQSYVLDRWDLAWDGINPPKLLERNFGFLGLILVTGPYQERYVSWLKRQPGYADVETFGDLGRAFQNSFRQVADEAGLARGKKVAVTVSPNHPGLLGGEMRRTGQLVARWIGAAGYRAVTLRVDGILIDVESKRTAVVRTYDWMSGKKKSEKKSDKKEGHKFSFHLMTYSTLNVPHIFPYYSVDNYTYNAAYEGSRIPFCDFKTQSLVPFWAVLMSNKGMMAVMHDLFPDHPNLLPTVLGSTGFRGQKRIVKLMAGRQGRGHRLYGANNRLLNKREDGKGAKTAHTRHHVTQTFSEAVNGAAGGYKIFSLFTANGQAAALGAQEATGPFVGNDDAKGHFLPVIVAPEMMIEKMEKAEEIENPIDPIMSIMQLLSSRVITKQLMKALGP